MQKRLIISLALTLSVAPLAAHAALVGTSCDKTQVGMTRMDTNEENIIACLKTGTNPPTYQWKSMSGGSGNPVQCLLKGNAIVCINTSNGKKCEDYSLAAQQFWDCADWQQYNPF